jgi:hypothetical protein
MFAHDLCHSQTILIKKTERSDTTNIQYSIVNIQFRLIRAGYLRLKILPDTGVRQYEDDFSQIQQIDTCIILPGRSIDGI